MLTALGKGRSSAYLNRGEASTKRGDRRALGDYKQLHANFAKQVAPCLGRGHLQTGEADRTGGDKGARTTETEHPGDVTKRLLPLSCS
jgi:hypothetical protein